MKPLYSYALIAAFAAIGQASAVEATTTPVGYSSQALAPGFNLVGLTLQTPTIAAGALDLSGGYGTELTDLEANFAPVAGKTYVLEITSGTLKGTIQVVPAANITAKTITTPSNLEAAGIQDQTTYKLRVAPTLEDVFTTLTIENGGSLNPGLNANGADVVWVPNGNGGYTKYFVHNSGAFRIAGTTTAAPNVPIVYSNGLLIEKKSAANSLVVSGEVKTIATGNSVKTGFNLISAVAPVGLTLRTAGFASQLLPGLNANGSDVVWIQQSDLSYKRYFLRSANLAWRDAGVTPAVDLDPSIDPPLSSAIYIERKGADANVTVAVPTSYGTL